MIVIRQLTHVSPDEHQELAGLLVDVVNGGSSVGFLAPLRETTAAEYWKGVASSIGPGLALWVAEHDGHIVGSVQLALCMKENGLHRAEIQKLVVHSAFRGKGISSRLMREVEQFARREGRTLLLLDTEAGSKAEAVYQHLDWQRLGEIPGYAKSSSGVLHATVYYYKVLSP